MAALIQESMLMNDGDVDCTIRRRLQEGVVTAGIVGSRDLTLRPIHKSAFSFPLPLDPQFVKARRTRGRLGL
jgi:hypothetical protein